MKIFAKSWRYSIQGLALFLLCASLILPARGATAWLRWGWMQYLGKISYSLYLYHWLVLWRAGFLCGSWPWWGQCKPVLLSLVANPSASYHWIERPGMPLRAQADG